MKRSDASTRTRTEGAPSALSALTLRPFRTGLLGALGVLVALAIGTLVGELATVLVYVGLALFLSLGLDPVVSWLGARMHRGLAVGVVVLGVVLTAAAFLFAVIPVLIEQASRLIRSLPRITSDIISSDAVAWVQDQLGSTFDVDDAILQGLRFLQDPDNLVTLGGGVAEVGFGVASGATGVVIVLILTLFFMASMRTMQETITRFVPAYDRESFAEITEAITGSVGRFVVGQLSLAAISGLMSLLFLTILGAPVPYLLAFVAFFGSMIPLVGPLTASAVISLVCLIASPQTALVAVIYYLIYMQIEAYVLSPRIMSRAVAVPGALVVIAAVAGGTLGGPLGALVSIPIAASMVIVVRNVVFPLQDSKRVDPFAQDREDVPHDEGEVSTSVRVARELKRRSRGRAGRAQDAQQPPS